jgi:hypothetical protein
MKKLMDMQKAKLENATNELVEVQRMIARYKEVLELSQEY